MSVDGYGIVFLQRMCGSASAVREAGARLIRRTELGAWRPLLVSIADVARQVHCKVLASAPAC